MWSTLEIMNKTPTSELIFSDKTNNYYLKYLFTQITKNLKHRETHPQ